MKVTFRPRSLLWLPALAAVLLVGCGGGGGGKVQGKLTRGGFPFAVPQGQTFSLSLKGVDGKAKDTVQPAKVNPADGSFVIDGMQGKGIPPGKYKITVSVTTGGTDPASLALAEQAKQEFAAIQDKEVDVSSEPTQTLNIDLVQGTVGK